MTFLTNHQQNVSFYLYLTKSFDRHIKSEFFSLRHVIAVISQQNFQQTTVDTITINKTSTSFVFVFESWLKKTFAFFSSALRQRDCQIWMRSSFFVKNVVSINLLLSFDRWKKLSLLNSFVDFLLLLLHYFLFSLVIIFCFVSIVTSFAKSCRACNHQQSRLQKTFENYYYVISKSFAKNFQRSKNFSKHFNKLTLSKIVVALTFQLKNYLHVEHQLYLNEFIDEIRRSIQRVTINRLRSFVVKSINKKIKINSFFYRHIFSSDH